MFSREMTKLDAKGNDIKKEKQNVKNQNEGIINDVLEELKKVKDEVKKLSKHVNGMKKTEKNQNEGFKNEMMDELIKMKDQVEKLCHCLNGMDENVKNENERNKDEIIDEVINVKNENERNKDEIIDEVINVKDQIEKLCHCLNKENENGSSLGIEKGKELPVQVEQQDVNDELVLSQNDGCRKRPLGVVEKCNKGMSDTRNEKDMKNPDDDLSARLNRLNTDPEYSEAKPTQSSDKASAEESKNFKNTSNNIAGTLSKSSEANSIDEKFNKLLEEPLKRFLFGFGDLKGILDNNDYVLQIAAHIKIEEDDVKSIIFTDHGGGNHALYLLELLKWLKPNLLIEEFQNHLQKPCYNEANNILMKYDGNETFQKVSHKDIRDLSFKLVPLAETNVPIWRDLAFDLEIDREDIAKIINMGMRAANFSRTEKLFEIISMRFPGFTIGKFLNALEVLKLNSAYELMKEKLLYKCK